MDFGRCRMIKPWAMWDNAIHADEAQISRQGRSMTYPFDFIINKKYETARFSSTTDIPFYRTSLHACKCYDFQARKLPCKHIYRLAVELGIIEIINRPSFDKDKLAEVKGTSDIHSHPEQLKRIATAKKADTTPISVDRENKTAVFKGSGKSDYITTLESCTCRDFLIRRLPCKHIYRLTLELEGMDVEHGINKNKHVESLDGIYTLPVESQKMLYDMCVALTQNCSNAFIYGRNDYTELLLHTGFCVETVLTFETISALPVAQIKQILRMSLPDRDDLPPKAAQRKKCVAWLEANYNFVSANIENSVIYLECSEHTEKLKHTIKRRYEKKFIKEQLPTEYYNENMELTLDYSETYTALKEYFSQE